MISLILPLPCGMWIVSEIQCEMTVATKYFQIQMSSHECTMGPGTTVVRAGLYARASHAERQHPLASTHNTLADPSAAMPSAARTV